MTMTTVTKPTEGLIGYMHEIEYKTDSVLVFQLPRATNQLSEAYLKHAKEALMQAMPEGRIGIMIGADVNIYELAGQEAVMLKLKGLI
jgi:hypothetical protein